MLCAHEPDFLYIALYIALIQKAQRRHSSSSSQLCRPLVVRT